MKIRIEPWHRIALTLIIALSLTPASWCAQGAEEQAPSGPLDVMAPYIGGVWVVNGKWSDGNALEAHEIFEWGPGKRWITCKTSLHRPDGTRFQRYETVFGVQEGKLTTWGFTFNGKLDTNTWQVDGKRLHTASTTPGVDVKSGSTLHQSIELIEPNSFRWIVSQEANGEKKVLIDANWIRSNSSDVTQKPITFGNQKHSDDFKPLETIAKLEGTWMVDAKWADGRPMHARQTIEPSVGKRFYKSSTQVLKHDGSVDYDRYLIFYGVDQGKLMSYRFVNDGSTNLAPLTVDGNRMSGTRTMRGSDGKELKLQWSYEFPDPDTIHWHVWQDGQSDKPLLDADWKRVAK